MPELRFMIAQITYYNLIQIMPMRSVHECNIYSHEVLFMAYDRSASPPNYAFRRALDKLVFIEIYWNLWAPAGIMYPKVVLICA